MSCIDFFPSKYFSGILTGRQLRFQLIGRYIFIHFYSDAAFTMAGFNITYRLVAFCLYYYNYNQVSVKVKNHFINGLCFYCHIHVQVH